MRNLKLIIEYDGSAYHGWQRQAARFSTIQQVLEEAIKTITRQEAVVRSSGRTDAGVHAMNQVAAFWTISQLPLRSILLGLNSVLPADIAVKSVEEADPNFHPRYSVVSKVYLYRILNRSTRSGLYRNWSWHVRGGLDLDAMLKAAGFIIGRHDFSSFCAANSDTEGAEREVLDCSLIRKEDFIDFTIEATGFLKYMVRNITGTLVYVGKGKFTHDDFKRILEAKDRTLAGPTAPPQGLYLKEVKY